MYCHDHQELTKITTKIDAIELFNEQEYFVFTENIFYPQGGGQKSDKGFILCDNQQFNVIKCIKNEQGNSIVLTDCENPSDFVGKTTELILYSDWRQFQTKMHTALHMMHIVIEEMLGQQIENPITSSIEDTFAYNKYKHTVVETIDTAVLEEKCNEYFSKDIPVTTYPDENDSHIRYWKCMDYVIPCGGLHVSSLKDVGQVHIVAHTKKGNTTYRITF